MGLDPFCGDLFTGDPNSDDNDPLFIMNFISDTFEITITVMISSVYTRYDRK